MTETALSATDNPINALEVELVHWPEKRLGTDEPNRRRYLSQVIRPVRDLHVLNGRPNPDVLGPGKPIGQTQGALRSLGEHLELMPVRAIHHVKDALYKVEREMGVEYVRHAVHENPSRLPPAERLLDARLPKPWCEGVRSVSRSVFDRDPAEVGVPYFRLR